MSDSARRNRRQPAGNKRIVIRKLENDLCPTRQPTVVVKNFRVARKICRSKIPTAI